ncbi:MAG TPA: phage major capsid protein [Xanthobacteraceae bacterium]|nr:phage major capsid protein [Xanthobacteraceae bacterium]
MQVIRKAAPGKRAGTGSSYVLSDATRDRLGDVIDPAGWELENFRQNPVALFNHQKDFVIGRWADVHVDVDDRLVGTLEPAKAGTSARIDEVLRLIAQGLLPAVSVGFQPLAKPVPLDPEHPERGVRYIAQELLETSIVPVPANPAALQLARSLNISDETIAIAFGPQAVTRQAATRGTPADPKPRPGVRHMSEPITISRQIEDRQSRLNAARDQLSEHTHDPDHDVEIARGLIAEIDEQEARLASLKESERRLGQRTVQQQEILPPVAAPAIARRPLGIPGKDRSPGDLYANHCVARFLSVAQRAPLEQVLAERFPNDEHTATVTRAAIAGATTTTAGWALELVQTGQGEFVNSLMPNQVFPPLAAMGMPLNFGPNAGAIKIPSRAATPSIGGSFVAEAAPIPVRRLGLTSITLYPHKVGGISVFSREIAAYSNPDIETIIRDAIIDDTQINIDALLLDAVAVSTTRPAGLTNGVVSLTATAGGGYAAFLGDLNKLTAPFYAANAGRRLAFLMNPQQRNQLVFAPGPSGVPFGWSQQFTDMFTVIASTSITAGAVYMIDAADFVSVTGAPEFDVSEVATVHMEDTTPLNIATGAQGSGVLATPTQSMFQTAQIAIRMVANVNWAMRRTGMVQFIGTGVNWA